jgi:uncharacterized membrane protein YphA (DoxX/SURF4 family)
MPKKGIAKEFALWIVALFLALVCLRSGLMKMPGRTGRAVLDTRFPEVGLPRMVSARGRNRRTHFICSTARAAISRFRCECFALVMLGAIFTHASHGESSRLPFNFLLLALSLIIVFARRPNLLKRLWKSQNN